MVWLLIISAASIIHANPLIKETKMPKMKSNSCAKKRFKVTGKGKVKYKQAYSRHMMMNKPKKMKRKARGTDTMYSGDERLVLRNFMPYERKAKRRAVRAANLPAGNQLNTEKKIVRKSKYAQAAKKAGK